MSTHGQAAFRGSGGLLGPALNLKELNLICWGLFLIGVFLPMAVVAIGRNQVPDADFAGFYSLGRILNEHPAQELYNFALQKKICTEVHALQAGSYSPLPHPPFVGVLFRPFAQLAYPSAYLLWISISLALYLAGLAIVSVQFFPQDPLLRSLIFCLALAYYPFSVETLVNGQLAAIGFLALAAALREDERGHPLWSGLALAACLYKPTLLVLVIPMLVVTRRFKTLLGFALGGMVIAGVTTAVEGLGVWSGYLSALLSFGRSSVGVETHSFLPLHKYVDLTSFSSLLAGGRSWAGMALISGFAGWAALTLVRIWWKSRSAGRPFTNLQWAATLTWTLLLNVYTPIYDSILVVLAIVVTWSVVRTLPDKLWQRWFTLLWLLILAGSWVTTGVAAATKIQLITLLLAAFGMLQFAVWRRLEAARPNPRASAIGVLSATNCR